MTLNDLEKITECDSSLDDFIRQIEEEALMPAPHYLKDSILERSRQLDVQAAVKTNQLSRQFQLFCYSLRVGTAVAGALLFLSLGPALMNSFPAMGAVPESTQMQEERPGTKLYRKTSRISDYIYQLSDQIVNYGGMNYDKKEK